MIKEEIENVIRKAVTELDFAVEEIPLEHPENTEYGDYSCNVAFGLAKELKKSPKEIAEAIKSKSQSSKSKSIEHIEAVGGFVNFFLSQEYLLQELQSIAKQKDKFGQNESLEKKKIMIEFAHPNTHKELHIGHMRTLITGEALARIFAACGAKVFRANYQGDIGPHVAKAIWGTEKLLEEQSKTWNDAESLDLAEKAHLLGEGYVKGNQEYEENKQEVDDLNTKLYEKSKEVIPLYRKTRQWSLNYFNVLYKRFDTKFDKLYFESEVADAGKQIVLKNMRKVFEKSQGAVIFDGEKYGLHKRVFLTQGGNPTYEGKEMGLAPLQYKDFRFDLNVHVVANEQADYFKVVFKALELVDRKFKGREYHVSMGMVQLAGQKMSSRTGVVVTVDGLLDEVKNSLRKLVTTKGLQQKEIEAIAEVGTIAAVKYSVLKTDTKSNVVFDIANSVALDGNSGPYLLYTYARCRSIVRKADITTNKSMLLRSSRLSPDLSKEEMDILRLVYQFPEVVQEAAEKYSPNLICNFAFDLAQKYNTFYNTHRVLEAETDEQKQFRLALTAATAQVISNSLHLLGIKTLERM